MHAAVNQIITKSVTGLHTSLKQLLVYHHGAFIACEPHHEKTGFSPVQKQRRRSAVQ